MIYDLAIVGAGLSAGPVIEYMAGARSDASIIILDRGIPDPGGTPPELQLVHHGRVKTLTPWWTSAQVGGAANLWYGQLSRFEGSDFRVPGAGDWIVNESEFAPSYDAIERMLRPFCANHLLTGVATLDSPGRTLRTRLARFERQVFDVLGQLGWAPYSGLTCLGGPGWCSAPVDPITLTTMRLQAPQFHIRNWVFRTERLLKNSANMTLAAGQAVSKLQPASGCYALSCLDTRQRESTFYARHVVLTAGPLSTVPLLHSLPEPSTLLGKKFTLSSELTAYVSTDLPRGDATDAMIGRFAHISSRYLRPVNGSDYSTGGKLSIYDAISFDGAKRFALKLAEQRINILDCGMVLKVSFKGTSECSDRKFIELLEGGEIVLHYEPNNTDLDLIIRAQDSICDLAAALPGGRILWISDNVRSADPTSAHLHGGAIFGGAPDTSVLSPMCEVWTAPGVFVADASFMPGSGSTNSSHTTMANALRVAQFIAERL